MSDEHDVAGTEPRPFAALDANLRMLRELPVGGEFDQEVAELLAEGNLKPLAPPMPPPGSDCASLGTLWAERGKRLARTWFGRLKWPRFLRRS